MTDEQTDCAAHRGHLCGDSSMTGKMELEYEGEQIGLQASRRI